MKITIIGTGYVGLVAGACFSEMGNTVVCVDIDLEKINMLHNGVVPIYEPGLKKIIQRNVDSDRLSFTTSLKKALTGSNIIFLAVGTPSDPSGAVDMQYVYSVAKDVGKIISKQSVIVNKSTVPIGTAEKVQEIISEELIKRDKNIDFHVVSNPEFLKEGNAIQDFMRPDRIIIGTNSNYALKMMKRLYSPFTMNHNRFIVMGIKEAELTKYAANSMLATKISFINEIAHICDKLKIDVESVRKGIGADSRIGYSFIYPGAGYGGSCFPKDIKAIIHIAQNLGVDPVLLESVERRNEYQKNRMFDYIKNVYTNNLKGKSFAIWGLSFKPDTDDMREAPSINLITSLIDAGAAVHAFDPIANDVAKKVFSNKWIKNKQLIFFDNNYSALENVDALVVMTEWKMFRNPSISKMKQLMRGLFVFDGRNQYDPKFMKQNGFSYKGIGR